MANGSRMASDAVEVIVAVLIGAIMAAALLPTAIDELVAVDTSSWGSTVVTLFDLLPLLIVLVPLAVFVGWATDAI